jgi:hypothetical protein
MFSAKCSCFVLLNNYNREHKENIEEENSMNTTTYVMRDQVKNVVPLMMTLDPKGENKPNRMTELATVACLAIGYLTIMTLVA